MEIPDAAVPTDQQSRFRIDRSTRNIQGRVTWCPSLDAWMLNYKASAKDTTATTSYNDATGKPLIIPGGLEGEAYTAARQEMYIRAIDAWNILDKSNQLRILPSARAGTCPSSPITSSSLVATSPALSSTVNASQTESGSIASEAASDNLSVACADDSLAAEEFSGAESSN